MKRKQMLALILSTSMFFCSTVGTIARAEEESSVETSQTQTQEENTETENPTKTENTTTEKDREESEEKPEAVEESEQTVESEESQESEQTAELEEPQTQEEEQGVSGASEALVVATQNTADTSKAAQGAEVWLNTTYGNDQADGASEANSVRTLKKALELAGEGGTITVNGSAGITIDGESVTLGNHITIVRGENLEYYTNLIYVLNGGELTLGDVTIDGGNVLYTETDPSRGALVRIQESKLTMKDGSILRNSTTGALAVNATTNGNCSVVMDGGEICNNNSEKSIPIIALSRDSGTYTTSFTMNGGSIHDNTTKWRTIAVPYTMTGVNASDGHLFTMNGGTITNNTVTGSTSNTAGAAAIEMFCGTFTMTGGSISNNTATSGCGGVTIDGDHAVANITGGQIEGNTGYRGGGILLRNGNLTVGAEEAENPKITNNKVPAKGNGAGVLLEGGTMELKNGTISGNSDVDNGGGGVLLKGGILNMSGGSISGNTSASGGGGGILLRGGGTLNMNGGSISGNTSVSGGGIDAWGNSAVDISGGTVSGNTATSYGGGVYIHTEQTVAEISGGTISGNNSPWAGGIFIYDKGTVNISGDTQITENKTTGERNGGGISLYGGTLNIAGGTISKNEAQDGAGIDVSSGTATVENGVKITENKARRNGGGVRISGGTLTIDGATISENNAEVNTGDAGGVLSMGGDLTIKNTTISDNVVGNRGGGLFIWNNGNVKIEKGTVITRNKADQGGGIDVCDHPLTIDGTIISENEASLGSGISIWDGGGVTVTDTQITGNKVVSQGTEEYAGAVSVWGSSTTESKFVMESGSIKDNTANGGRNAGLSLLGANSNGVAEIHGGEISGNTNESGEKQGIRLFKFGEKNGVLRLSGSPAITDEVFLNDDQDPEAKIEISGEFTPNSAVKVNDTSWTDYRTIVTYAQGLTAKTEDFTPASGFERQYIIKDGQDLKSMNKITVIFREKDSDKKYGEAYVVAKDKISESQIPEAVKKGYELTGWKNEADDREWDFAQDTVSGDLVLNPIWKLKLPKGTVRAVDGKTDIHEGEPVTLEATATHEAEGNITCQFTWFKDGKEIENTTEGRAVSDTRCLTVTEAGTYSVKVTATDGTQTTEAVEIGSVEVTASSHIFGEWIIVKKPTETKTGLKERTCTICGMKEQEEIPATGKNKDPTDPKPTPEDPKPDPEDPEPAPDDKKDDAKPETDNKKETVVTKTTTTTIETTASNGVKTGDTSALGFAAAAMALAAGAGVGVIGRRKKKKDEL